MCQKECRNNGAKDPWQLQSCKGPGSPPPPSFSMREKFNLHLVRSQSSGLCNSSQKSSYQIQVTNSNQQSQRQDLQDVGRQIKEMKKSVPVRGTVVSKEGLGTRREPRSWAGVHCGCQTVQLAGRWLGQEEQGYGDQWIQEGQQEELCTLYKDFGFNDVWWPWRVSSQAVTGPDCSILLAVPQRVDRKENWNVVRPGASC
jgi:hypothetical protein